MKKLLFLLIATSGVATTNAQVRHSDYTRDSLLSRWVIDVNLLGGINTQTFKTASTFANYPGALNMNTGTLNYNNGTAYGADAQLGFFWGKKRHFGVGAGIMYMQQQGDAVLNNYHAEYQATDKAGNIYRQVVTGDKVTESITSTNINIPLVLKYKNRFSKHWGFAADAGALLNLQMNNAYSSHSAFDYEAIYQLVQNGDGGKTSVYDNSPVPSVNDWLVTRAEFLRNNPNGNVQNYFAAERASGINVGLNQQSPNTKGTVAYNQSSIGLILRPTINYFLSDHVALNFGLFYMYQPFMKKALPGYRLADVNGNYSSVMNSVTNSDNQSYGLNIGVRFFLGKSHPKMSDSYSSQNAPTQCGSCDGSITLHGLIPNRGVTVNYSKNGTQAESFTTMVQADSTVKIPNLCAGSYSGIVATMKKGNAKGTDMTLTDPTMNISGQSTTNPTLAGRYDGSVVFKGLYADSSVTLNYYMNGVPQPPAKRVVGKDNTIKIDNLGEGRYTGIVATMNKCSANGGDFTLAAPPPPPPPPAAIPTTPEVITVTTKEGIDISTPILFDVNLTVIHDTSFAVIDEAVKDLNMHRGSFLVIDGNADSTGGRLFNDSLSLGRANSIKKALTDRGISPSRVKTKGHGSRLPVATNRTYEGKQENRNGVMKIKFAKKKSTVTADLK